MNDNFTRLESEAGIIKQYYVGAEDMLQDGLSRSAAHRLLHGSPSRILVKVQGRRAYLAIPRTTYELLLAQRRPRGNPRMQDSEFQTEMALRRWHKGQP